jgi:hypothetical protein
MVKHSLSSHFCYRLDIFSFQKEYCPYYVAGKIMSYYISTYVLYLIVLLFQASFHFLLNVVYVNVAGTSFNIPYHLLHTKHLGLIVVCVFYYDVQRFIISNIWLQT